MTDHAKTRPKVSIGYFLNTYPTPSGTFIRDEIRAHEVAGHPVKRFAIRPWRGDLVDPEDRTEQTQTRYILDSGLPSLLGEALRETIRNPMGTARALAMAFTLALKPRGRHVFNFMYFLEAVRLKNLAAEAKIDHIHAHFSTNATTVPLLSRLLGGPHYSFTVHGPDEIPVMGPNGIIPKLRHAAFAVAITDYTKEAILAETHEDTADKVYVIRCGVSRDRFHPSAPVDDDNFRLVCVGRLCPQKAQTDLIEAVARLKDKYPRLRLTLIGDGETRNEIEALVANYDLQDVVHLRGWLAGERVREAISASRALVLPSYAEGLPMVIMEAMLLERPVISTQIAGIPELVDGKCGWVVPPRNVEDLAGAIDTCLATSACGLAALGAEGRSRVERLHDVERNASELRDRFRAAWLQQIGKV